MFLKNFEVDEKCPGLPIPTARRNNSCSTTPLLRLVYNLMNEKDFFKIDLLRWDLACGKNGYFSPTLCLFSVT
jgi:hypothetical protein